MYHCSKSNELGVSNTFTVVLKVCLFKRHKINLKKLCHKMKPRFKNFKPHGTNRKSAVERFLFSKRHAKKKYLIKKLQTVKASLKTRFCAS